MTRDELVEAMAFGHEYSSALYPPEQRLLHWSQLTQSQRAHRMDAIRAALSAAEAQGWVLVPRARLERWAIEIYNDGTPAQAGPTVEEIRAMIPTPPQEDTDG